MTNGIVIFGAHGMLGGQLHTLLPDAVAFDHHDLDVTDFTAVEQKLDELKPNIIINCVAYNDVDGAETNPAAAHLLNTEVVQNLARISNRHNALLIHFSTGYVFDGTKDSYTEDDSPHPLSVYAQSKAAGEKLLQQTAQRYYLIRTNVIFGPAGKSEKSKKSFVDIMLELSAKQDTIKVVNDEANSITFASDLAQTVVQMIERNLPTGIYHIVNEGCASWFELAQEIFAIMSQDVILVPVSSAEFPRPAKRAARIILQNTKLPLLRTWQAALKEYLT